MDARTYAVLTLDDRDLPGYSKQAFKRKSAVRPTDPRDAALGETIVLGVIRNLRFLEHHLQEYAKRPLGKIDPRSKLILLVALYQLKLLDRVPESAAVNEAVRQARLINTPTSMGFVNAVLREALRNPDVPLPPEAKAAEYAEIVLSHPPACFGRFARLMGEADALACCRVNNLEPPTLVRLLAGRSIDDARAAVPDAEFLEHEEPGIVVVSGAKQSDYATLSTGRIGQVQDATSARTVTHVDYPAGCTVLDRCCGVGTKTLQIHDRQPDAKILAIDSHGKRMRTLRQTAARLGIDSIETARVEWLAGSEYEGRTFDRVLVDAPCSNSGVIRRRPEARFRQDDVHVAELVELQRKILDDTLPFLAPGGKLTWATCSVWPEENRRLVGEVIGGGVSLAEDRLTLPALTDDPAKHHDGGYVAVLERAP